MSMPIDKRLSQKFSNMALLCSALVCFIHIHLQFADSGIALRIQHVIKLVTRIAVPFFFFSSGYFLAAHVNETGWWRREVCKRIATLAVPYILFCTIYAVCESLLAQKVLDMSWSGFLSYYGLNAFFPAASPLWYVRGLIVLIVVSPIVFWAIRKFKWYAIVCAALVYLCASSALVSFHTSQVLRFVFPVQGLFYLSVGGLFRLNKIDVLAFLERSKCKLHYLVLAGLSGALLIDFLTGVTGVRVINLECVIPFFLVAVWSLVPTCNVPAILVGKSFPIYCLHALFISLLRMFVCQGGGGLLFDCPWPYGVDGEHVSFGCAFTCSAEVITCILWHFIW